MNPHDPTDRPGAHLVSDQFGVADPWELTENYSPSDARDLTGRAVAETARNLDGLHDQLRRAARTAIELLTPIEHTSPDEMRGQYSVLGDIGLRIELLAARRDAAYTQLIGAMDTYRRVQTAPEATRPTNEPSHAPSRDNDWAIEGDRRLTPQGEAALRETRTTTPRVTAALNRSNAPASPGHVAGSATAPVAGTSPTASRFR